MSYDHHHHHQFTLMKSFFVLVRPIITTMYQVYIGVILYGVSASLHFLGTILLHGLKSNSLCSSTQRMILINLCMVEMLLALNGVLIRLCVILRSEITIIYYVEYVQLVFFNPWYIFLMIFLTLDRFMAVHYNIQYPLKWSSKKTKFLLCAIPFISLWMSALVMVYFKPWQRMMAWKEIYDFLFFFVLPPFNFMFLLVATLTYIYLYHKIRQNWTEERRTVAHITRTNDQQMLPKEIKRGFYTPTLLVLTFLLFWSIPDLVFSVHFYQNIVLDPDVRFYLILLYPIGTILDALVLVFLPFLEKIKRRIRQWRN